MIQTDQSVSLKQPSQEMTENYENNIGSVDYSKIAKSDVFMKLCKEKKRFTICYTVFFLLYSLILPYLAISTTILNGKVIGEISWAWIYGISMIPMAFIVSSIYQKKADYFDKEAKCILENQEVL